MVAVQAWGWSRGGGWGFGGACRSGWWQGLWLGLRLGHRVTSAPAATYSGISTTTLVPLPPESAIRIVPP